MAEALGVAASVAGLITLADVVLRRGYTFMKEVKGAEETIKKLVDEVNIIFGILHSLKNVVEQLEEGVKNQDSTMQVHWIDPCYKTLEKIRRHLLEAMEGDSMSRVERFKWPLKQSATRDLLKDVERHKATIMVAMSAKEMSALCQIQDGVDDLKAAFDSDRTERKEIFIDEKRHKMLQLLGTIDARNWQDSNIRLRQPATGIWFIDGPDFKLWLSEERSKLWVNGIPGAGKTILMSSIIQQLERSLKPTEALAFFYCDYKDTNTHSASTILGSLARQLIMRDENCFGDLTKFYDDHISPDRSIRTPMPEEICQLIVKVSSRFDTIMIVVDGLDEILDGRANVSNLLGTLNTCSGSIKTLFASRPEVDIAHVLDGYFEISIAAQSSDLRLYIACEIERRTKDMRLEIQDPNLKEHIMTTLAEGAEGMFRWAACQMDYLCECSNDKDRREALRKLPPDLPSSYERILERVNRSTKENQLLVQNALHWIVHAKKPLLTKTLLEALAVHDGDVTFDSSGMSTEKRLLHWCSSLVRKKIGSDGLELAHFTVKEFLFAIDPLGRTGFSQYRLSEDHAVLAKACFNVLKCVSFDGNPPPNFSPTSDGGIIATGDEIVGFETKYPLFVYAVKNWCHHAHDSDHEVRDDHILELFIANAPNFRNLTFTWLYYACSGCDSADPYTILDASLMPSPLHWAALFALSSTCAKLLEGGMDVNKQSAFGTPLNCAILSTMAIGSDFVLDNIGLEYPFDYPRNARLSTIETILGAVASVDLTVSPLRCTRRNALDIALILDASTLGFDITEMLLEAGASVSLENIAFLIEDMKSNFEYAIDDYIDSRSLILAVTNSLTQTNVQDWKATFACSFFQYLLWELCARCSLEPLEVLFETEILGALPYGIGKELTRILHRDATSDIMRYTMVLSEAIKLCAMKGPVDLDFFWSDMLSSHLILYNDTEKMESTFLHQLLETDRLHSLREELDPEKRLAIEALLDCGVSVTAMDKQGRTPLDLAAMHWDMNTFMLLWNSVCYDVLLETNQDQIDRVFYVAIRDKNEVLIEFLLGYLRRGQRKYGDSLLLYALEQHDTDALHLVIEFYTKFSQLFKTGDSPLCHAAKPDISIEILQYLIDRGWSGLAKSSNGNTCFHYLSTMHDDIAKAKLRVLLGIAGIQDVLNHEGLTPLALAVRCKNMIATRMFLDAGAFVDMRLARGQTALHLACCLGNVDAVGLLLEKSANPTLQDDSGMTPRDIALTCGYEGLVNTLQNSMHQLRTAGNMDVTITESGSTPDESCNNHHGKLPYRPLHDGLELSAVETTQTVSAEQSRIRATDFVGDGGMFGDDFSDGNAAQPTLSLMLPPIQSFIDQRETALKRPYQSIDCAILGPAANKVRRT